MQDQIVGLLREVTDICLGGDPQKVRAWEGALCAMERKEALPESSPDRAPEFLRQQERAAAGPDRKETDRKEGEHSSRTLPDGRAATPATTEDLFDAFLGQLSDIREQVHTLLYDIDKAFVPRILSYKRLVDARGGIMIAWPEAGGGPVDVFLRAREVGA